MIAFDPSMVRRSGWFVQRRCWGPVCVQDNLAWCVSTASVTCFLSPPRCGLLGPVGCMTGQTCLPSHPRPRQSAPPPASKAGLAARLHPSAIVALLHCLRGGFCARGASQSAMPRGDSSVPVGRACCSTLRPPPQHGRRAPLRTVPAPGCCRRPQPRQSTPPQAPAARAAPAAGRAPRLI